MLQSEPEPDLCPQCAEPLERRWEMHCSGTDKEGQRRTGWLEWAYCLACELFFIQCIPPSTDGEKGWQIEQNPPVFVRNPNWLDELREALRQREEE